MSAGTEKGQSGLAYIHKCKSHVAHFLSASPPEKQKKNPPRKKFLIFSQKELLLYFGKWKPRKKFLYFRKRSFQSSKNEKASS